MKMALMPDGKLINLDQVLNITISGSNITFEQGSSPPVYSAPNPTIAAQALAGLQNFLQSGDTYRDIFSTFSGLAIFTLDGGATVTTTLGGGATITVVGQGFVNGCTVKINAVAAAVTFVSANQITFIAPAVGSPNPGDLTLTNPDGSLFILPTCFGWT